MPAWPAIFDALSRLGVDVADSPAPRAIGGGDISAAWRVPSGSGAIFLKTGPKASFDMFDAEADGLRALQRAGAVRVPEVLACGSSGAGAFLALEWLALDRPGAAAAARFGRRLAAQHRQSHDRFGWRRDNWIGRTPQVNAEDDDWLRFFKRRRLQFQLDLAARNGYTGELQDEGPRVAERMERLFDGYDPPPSLLHGDLWGANWTSVNKEPVIFDPAVHYGDRECDIAMTRLFGGFGAAFYRAYEAAWPLAAGHRERLPLYQLYHVLNHLNLFGGSYLGQALELIRRLNREMG